MSEKPHILSVSEKPPLSTWGACKNRSQPQLKVSFKFVVPPDDKNCKWDEFWKDVSLRIDLRASKGVGIPKEKNLYDWMKLTKTPQRRISAFAMVLVNQQANARTMLWTESLNFFFGSKMSLNLGHFEPRVLWKWVARVVAWGVRVSAYFACTSHVLYMPTHLCPRVEGGSGVNRNIQRVHDASIYPSAKACLILTLVWYIYRLIIHATNFSGAAPRNNVGGSFEATHTFQGTY